ncbi:MAG: general secretion pathway protein GspB [Candidatus Thiodiazotropha sp.]
MSSILDALERASKERMPGKTDILPDTAPLPDEYDPMLRRWLVLAILLVLILALFWLLFSGDTSEPETPRQIEQQRSPLTRQQATQASARDTSAARIEKNSPAPEKKVLTAERIRNSSQPNQRPLVSEAMLSQAQQRKRTSDSSRPAPAEAMQTPSRQAVKAPTRPLPPATVVSKRETLEADPQPVVSGSEAAGTQVVSVDAGEETAADAEQMAQQQIPLIWEMDQALREELEQLKTTIHVYHEKASQRFVIINMQRYREGDTLGRSGYRLHAIDREGIVVDYGGGLVRLLREMY